MPMMSTLSFSFLFLLCLSTNTFNVVLAKSILETPFEIQSVTSLLQRDGCKSFYDLLSTSSEAMGYFLSNAPGGVTVFCPSDDAVTAFAPIYKNLTGDQKTSLLLYHGVPVYFSMEMLRSSNGLMNTLATDGNNRFDFILQNDGNDIKLKSKVVTATITGTVVDDYGPVAVYKIDKVLMPRELLKGVIVDQADEPAPAPKAVISMDADAPSPSDYYGDLPEYYQMANSGGRMVASMVMALFLVVTFIL